MKPLYGSAFQRRSFISHNNNKTIQEEDGVMNQKKRLCFQLLLVLVVAAFGILVNQSQALSTESPMIRIESTQKGLVLNPQTLTINKGAVVVWVEMAADVSMVKLMFNDPVACQETTAEQITKKKFYPKWGDCYTTTYLKFPDTTSLQFNKAGTLPYTVVTENGKMKVSGKIIVK
jgi:plastocyanin